MSQYCGVVIWLTGLPCSGKTTIATELASQLCAQGRRVEVLDGDAMRPVLSGELGYSRRDRETNVLRIAHVAGLLAKHGVTVVVAAVSPHESVRAQARQKIGRFFEVHVDCTLAECEKRDVKGMYALARAGAIREFTGIDSPYEVPTSPELRVSTIELDVDAAVAAIRTRLHDLAL